LESSIQEIIEEAAGAAKEVEVLKKRLASLS
jgi:hypothetical protein